MKEPASEDSSAFVWTPSESARGMTRYFDILRHPEFLQFFTQKFNVEEDVLTLTTMSRAAILQVIDWYLQRNVSELRVLDLGCGSTVAEILPENRQYEPWLCRALHAMGADVVGIDIRDNSKEPFPHHRWDMSQPELLDALPEDHFDLVHSADFLPPSLTSEDEGNFSPTLARRVDAIFASRQEPRTSWREEECQAFFHEYLKTLRLQIAGQVQRLLRVGGYYVWDGEIYKKGSKRDLEKLER